MAGEWRPLGEFISLVSGNTPSKSNPDFWGGTTPWVSAKDMSDFWLEDSEDHLTPLGVGKASRIVPAGTVLMLTRGMTLHNRVPICRVTKDAAFNQDVKAVLPKDGLCVRFLPYLLTGNHDRLHERVDSAGHGTGRLNTDEILSLRVFVPNKAEQTHIAEIGEALDERIDNLRQTNATLQAIAAALFKSRFVDFDGVLPEDMQESELGLIPKGWRVGSVYDIADVRYGAPFASSKFNTEGDGLPLVRIRDLHDEKPGVWTPEVHPKGYLIKPGDIIVGMDGEFRAYLWGGEPSWMNQRICAFHPKKPHCAVCVHNAIVPHLARIEATEVATTVIHLGKGDIDEFRVVVPPNEVAEQFAAQCQPLYDRIVTNKQQAATLAALRDTLLPRLISRRLKLPQPSG